MIENLPRTSQVIEEGIAAGLHLGAQVYVSVDGKVAADGAMGEARAGLPLDRDQLITWWSMTKATVAVSIAQLWERGAIALDDTIAHYIPEFAANGKERITIRHCLTHTGGFRQGDGAIGAATAKEPEAWWNEMIAAICAVPLEKGWVPGAKAGYHLLAGMAILGEVIRRVDGRSYSQYVRDEVFLPLGMSDCWVGMPLDKAAEYTAAGRVGAMHYTVGDEPIAIDRLDTKGGLTRCSPSAGGRGPMHQLARMYEALGRWGERDGVRILEEQTVAAITARHRVGLFDETFGIVLDWGLGFGIDSSSHGRHSSRRVFGHGGARSSMAYADPEFGLVVAVQFNGMPTTHDHYVRMAKTSDAIYEDVGLADPSDPGRVKEHPTESDVSA